MALRDRLRTLFQAPTVSLGEKAYADTRRIGFFGPTERYNPDDLVGRKGLQIYDEMRRDEQVKACLALKAAAIVGPGWTVEPADPDDGASVELAETIQADLLSLPGTLEDGLLQILSAHAFGFSLSELVFEDAGDRIKLKDLKARAPFGFTFDQDAYGNIESIRQQSIGAGEPLPVGKFVHYVHDPEFSNPYGRSDLWAVHKPWFMKRVFLQAWASFTERYGEPPSISRYPKGTPTEIVNKVQEILKNLQARTAISLPQTYGDWPIDLLQTSHSPREFFIAAIDRLDLAISRGILVPEKLGFAGGEIQGGSYSLAQVQLGAFFFILDLIKARLTSVVNEQLIRVMAELAAPGLEPPRIKLNPLTQDDKQAVATMWSTLTQNNVVVSDVVDENHIRQLMGFPEVEESDDQRRQAILERKQEQADALAEGLQDQGGPPKAKGEEMAAVPGAMPTPSQVTPVPETFWRPLRPVEERADMAEQRRLLDEGTTELGMILADDMDGFLKEVRQQAERVLARKSPEEIAGMGVDSSRRVGMFTKAYASLSRSYVRGARKARSEVKR